jgi:hypothetical protein
VDAVTDDDNMSPEKMAGEDVKQITATLSKGFFQVAGNVPEHSVTGNDGNPTMQSNAPQTTHEQSSQSDTHQKHERKLSKLITGSVNTDDMSCIRVGLLTLHVEYSTSHNGATENVRKDLRFDVEWITDANDGPSVASFKYLESSGYRLQRTHVEGLATSLERMREILKLSSQDVLCIVILIIFQTKRINLLIRARPPTKRA